MIFEAKDWKPTNIDDDEEAKQWVEEQERNAQEYCITVEEPSRPGIFKRLFSFFASRTS